MDAKLIIIIGLLLLSYTQYIAPEKTTFITDPTWGKVKEFFDTKGWFQTKTKPVDNGPCPDTLNYVCGSNGVTYDNICKAALADILQVTPGRCEDA